MSETPRLTVRTTMFSGRKKKDLEIEVDESAEGAERSGKSRAGTAATTANSTLIPRWVQILHYVMHAVLLVIIILLIVAIALVESDARDDTDGTANKILRAFHLQVDGSVSNTFDCPGGSPAAASVADGGDVSSVCRANALGFVGHPYSSSGTIDGYDKYTNVEAFYYVDDEGSQWTYEMYKARLEPYCCGISEGPLKGDPPKIQAFMSGSRAIVYLEQKMDAYDSIRSYFTTLDCDADGKVINRIRYPALDHENVRVEAATILHDMFTGKEDISMLDTLRFSDDFVLTFSFGNRYYGAEAVGYLRDSTVDFASSLPPESTFEPYFYYQQGFATSSVIVKWQWFIPGQENPVELGFIDIVFDVDDKIVSLSYSPSEQNDLVTMAHQFHEVWAIGSPVYGKINTWDDLTAPTYEMHNSAGKILTYDEFKSTAKAWVDSGSNAIPANRKYFQFPNDRESVYVLYSRTGENPASVIWRHVFENGKIRTSFVFSTVDISGMSKAMDAFESTRKYIAGASNNLDDFDSISVTEDAAVNTFWSGLVSMDDFRLETIQAKGTVFKTGKLKDAEYVTRRKLVFADPNQQIGLVQGMWVPKGSKPEWQITPATSSGIIESTADMFYFDVGENSKPQLSMVYMYNSTDAMQA